jgi:hypothetical protein
MASSDRVLLAAGAVEARLPPHVARQHVLAVLGHPAHDAGAERDAVALRQERRHHAGGAHHRAGARLRRHQVDGDAVVAERALQVARERAQQGVDVERRGGDLGGGRQDGELPGAPALGVARARLGERHRRPPAERRQERRVLLAPGAPGLHHDQAAHRALAGGEGHHQRARGSVVRRHVDREGAGGEQEGRDRRAGEGGRLAEHRAGALAVPGGDAQAALALDERDHGVAAPEQRRLARDHRQHVRERAVVDERPVDLGQRLHLRQVPAHPLQQSRVVDGRTHHPAQRGQEVQVRRREGAHLEAAHRHHADRTPPREQRDEDAGAQADRARRLPHALGRRQVGDHHRRLAHERPPDGPLADPEAGDGGDVVLGHAAVVGGGPQLAGVLVHEEDAGGRQVQCFERGRERRLQEGVEIDRPGDRRGECRQDLDVSRLQQGRAHRKAA